MRTPSINNNKIAFSLVVIITITLIVDTSVAKIYYFSLSQSPVAPWRAFTFTLISSVSVIGLYFIRKFVKYKSETIRSRNALHMNALHSVMTISQYVLMAFVLILVLEIILIFLYNVLLLTLVIWTSYSTAVFMISVLAYRFFSWFRSKRNSVVLLYGISSAALGINAVFSVLFATVLLTDLPPYAVPHVGHENPFFILGGATAILNSGYITSTVLSFMLWWVATVFLLHHYSERARRKTYWIILGLPLVYFVVQFQPIFLDLFSSLLSSQPVLFSTVYTLIFTLSKPVGGILFGIAFWTIARKLDANNPVRNYMMISAFGLVLIFVSDEASALVSAPYPPFGVPTVSFMGLASYLVLVGIYSSAVSVAADSRLRQSIRNYTLRESRLLDSIGMAQMGQEIENKVMVLTEENRERIEEETGIQSSLTEEDIKQYLEQVINEVKKQKAPADKKP